jgi:anhydro-N-acetylmuramic acid kinase
MANVRSVIGLMSGTSMDGIDVAHLLTDGEAAIEWGGARTYPYSDADRSCLAEAMAAARGVSRRDERPPALARAEALVTTRHGEAMEQFCRDERLRLADIDLVGFHGQTVLHDPAQRLTMQLGDGQALAGRLGTPVAWDFRAADMAAGGQGAPLAPAFHRALARKLTLPLPVVFLNIGGVANATWVGPGDSLIAFDTGPGNALLDDWVRRATGAAYDSEGRLAALGHVDGEALHAMMRHGYFAKPPPKSLDRNAFTLDPVAGMRAEKGAATLLAFTVDSIVAARTHFPMPAALWIACGGGRHNATLLRQLGEALAQYGEDLLTAEGAGLDGDALEAQAFAYLAVRACSGTPITFPGTTGVPAPLTGGRIAKAKGGAVSAEDPG